MQLRSTSSENSKTPNQDLSLIAAGVALGFGMSLVVVVVAVAPDRIHPMASLVAAEVTLHIRVRGPLALVESQSTTTMILGTVKLPLVLVVSQLTTMTILGTFDLLPAHAVRLRTAPKTRMIRIQSLVVLLTKVPVDVGKIMNSDRKANLCTISKICLTRCQWTAADLIIAEKIEGTLVVPRMIHTTTDLIIVEKIEDILVMVPILPTTTDPTHQFLLLGELDLIMIVSTILHIRTTDIQADNSHLCPLGSGASNFPPRTLQREAVPHTRSFQRTNPALLIMGGITHASPGLVMADTTLASSSLAGMAAATQDRLAPLSMVMRIPPIPAHHLAIPTIPPAAHLPPLTTHTAIPHPPPNPSVSSLQRVITPFSVFPAAPRLTRSKPRIAR